MLRKGSEATWKQELKLFHFSTPTTPICNRSRERHYLAEDQKSSPSPRVTDSASNGGYSPSSAVVNIKKECTSAVLEQKWLSGRCGSAAHEFLKRLSGISNKNLRASSRASGKSKKSRQTSDKKRNRKKWEIREVE